MTLEEAVKHTMVTYSTNTHYHNTDIVQNDDYVKFMCIFADRLAETENPADMLAVISAIFEAGINCGLILTKEN